MVSFGDGGVGDGRAGNNRSVVPKHIALASDGNSKISQDFLRMSMIWSTAVLAATYSDP